MEEKLAKNMSENDCVDCKMGSLPSCAPLAFPYVPVQGKNPQKYSSENALTRGTLFPGLDLPFMNDPNVSNPYAGTPLGELMALDFMIDELNLYLDTHSDDTEAFSMLQSAIKLFEEGKEKYVSIYGPLTISDLKNSSSYNWLMSPWPWQYEERK